MSIDVRIGDGFNGGTAKVTKRNQLVTAPLEFSKFYTASVTVNDTAANLLWPRAGKRFVITEIILNSDRDVGVNGAITKIFEAANDTTATVSTLIYEDEVAKQTRAVLTGLNIIVSEGVWVNVVADDVIVRANVAGYYIDA
jgi:hypothetical protein